MSGSKTNKRAKKGVEIVVPENAREFYLKNLFFVYNHEKERENTLLEQASRLLIAETLIATVFFQIILSKTDRLNTDYYFTMGIIIGILLVGALITTLISQHRFFRVGTPDFDEVKNCFSKSKSDMKTMDLEFEYNEAFVERMYKSLKILNDFRFWLLTISVILVLSTLIGGVLVVIELAKEVLQ